MNNSSHTFESVWVALQESNRIISEKFAESERLRQENERFLTEKHSETDRLIKDLTEKQAETDRILRESRTETERIIKESSAAVDRQIEKVSKQMEQTDKMMGVTSEKQAETDRILRESRTETDRILRESRIETERIIKESSAAVDRQIEKVSKQMERTDKMMGGISNSNGLFAEEYFFNSIKKDGKTLFGEKFDKLIKTEIIEDENHKTRGEFDTLLINCTSAAIIEMKYRVRKKYVAEMMKKVKPFRDKFPEYRNHRLYLGFASLVFDEEVEKECLENGIAVIKQVGDSVVVYDENLKTF